MESDRYVYSHAPSSTYFCKDHNRRLRRSRKHASTGGRTITNLRFADDIDSLTGEEEALAKLVERLDKAPTAYGMEISAEKNPS